MSIPTFAKQYMCDKNLGFENRATAQGALNWPKNDFLQYFGNKPKIVFNCYI